MRITSIWMSLGLTLQLGAAALADDLDGTPLGEPMVAIKNEAGEWSLWPAGDLDD